MASVSRRTWALLTPDSARIWILPDSVWIAEASCLQSTRYWKPSPTRTSCAYCETPSGSGELVAIHLSFLSVVWRSGDPRRRSGNNRYHADCQNATPNLTERGFGPAHSPFSNHRTHRTNPSPPDIPGHPGSLWATRSNTTRRAADCQFTNRGVNSNGVASAT